MAHVHTAISTCAYVTLLLSHSCFATKLTRTHTSPVARLDHIADTASSGRRGKGDACWLYRSAGLAANPPFYAADANFDCGTKRQLQPTPPTGGGGGGSVDAVAPCVTVVAINGSRARFCADKGQTSTDYSSITPTSAAWELSLADASSGITVLLTGNMSVTDGGAAAIADVGGKYNRSVYSWTLLTAQSEDMRVRAVDLEFAFVGLSSAGDRYYYTASSKTWCPEGNGCMAWACRTLQGTVGAPEPSRRQLGLGPASRFGGVWASNPPSPLPWAAVALADPARSNGVGAWTSDGKAGLGAYSSQRTLPFRRWAATGSVGFGSSQAPPPLPSPL